MTYQTSKKSLTMNEYRLLDCVLGEEAANELRGIVEAKIGRGDTFMGDDQVMWFSEEEYARVAEIMATGLDEDFVPTQGVEFKTAIGKNRVSRSPR